MVKSANMRLDYTFIQTLTIEIVSPLQVAASFAAEGSIMGELKQWNDFTL